MKTDRGKVLRRKVEKNAEKQVKRTWNCIEGTEWEEKERWRGLLRWREKGQCAQEKKGFHRGRPYRMSLLGASKLLAVCWGKRLQSVLWVRCGARSCKTIYCLVIIWFGKPRSSINGASSFKVFLSSSRLVTRTKESCSMKSILVANQDA